MQQPKRVKIVLVGGGSGGHITPLIALARKIHGSHPNWRVTYIGDWRSADWRSAITANQSFIGVKLIITGKIRRYSGIMGWAKFRLWRNYLLNVADFFLIIIGCLQSFFLLLFDRPTVIFSKGGVSALGVCLSGILLRIPIITHDSDAICSLTHKLIGRYARLKLSGMPLDQVTDEQHVYVGIPVAESLGSSLSTNQLNGLRKKYKLPSAAKIILVLGGGQGARSVNRGVLGIAPQLKPAERICLLVITGRGKYSEAKLLLDKLDSLKLDVRLVEFSNDVPALLQLSDWVVTRAGATALAEVAAANKPAIIIPNPILPSAHQIHNANRYLKNEAALIVNDSGSQVDLDGLKTAIELLLSDQALCSKLGANIAKLAIYDASDRTLQAMERVIT